MCPGKQLLTLVTKMMFVHAATRTLRRRDATVRPKPWRLASAVVCPNSDRVETQAFVPRLAAENQTIKRERNAKLRTIIENVELWLFPVSVVALGIALAILWYANSAWRASAHAPQVAVAEMTPLPEPSPFPVRRPR